MEKPLNIIPSLRGLGLDARVVAELERVFIQIQHAYESKIKEIEEEARAAFHAVEDIRRSKIFAGPLATPLVTTNREVVTVGTGNGTVTSIGLTMPAMFNVANSPISVSGEFQVTYNFAGIADGQYLKRSGVNIVGDTPNTVNIFDYLNL